MTSVVVDTHALIWFLEGNSRLSKVARHAIEEAEHLLIVPVIALAEAMWVVEQGRTGIPNVAQLLLDIAADPRVSIAPLTSDIAVLAHSFSGIPEMHDRLVVATALAHDQGPCRLITKDQSIKDSGLVEVVW